MLQPAIVECNVFKRKFYCAHNTVFFQRAKHCTVTVKTTVSGVFVYRVNLVLRRWSVLV